MAIFIMPFLAVGDGEEIVIDGITYKVPRVDSGGRLLTAAHVAGASEVKSNLTFTVSNSLTRATAITPTSGKKVRIISCVIVTSSGVANHYEVYFGTAASISVATGKEILLAALDVDYFPTYGLVWPDGSGPVGAVDEVVSIRTGDSDIAGLGKFLFHYREE